MKYILLIFAIIFALEVNAQNYLISFTCIGASTTLSTVKVENLSSNTTLTLNGDDILNLTFTTGLNSNMIEQSSLMNIYPNPMTDNAILEIHPPAAGDATISICDMTGRQVTQIFNYLENSAQRFRLTGLKKGLYLINVKNNSYHFSGKLLSNRDTKGIIKIEKIDIASTLVTEKISGTSNKGTQTTYDMLYTAGDILRFTGASSIYRTVLKDIPTSDKTITFDFISCIDGDNNSYSQVAIGNQVWMVENLKTTKYRNGDLIGTTNPYDKNITLESNPKYQWAYSGNESNVATYGRLYTWYAVTDSRYVCPSGWHVPTESEWTTLESYMIASGYNYDGTTLDNKIAKALASTSLWTLYTAISGTVGNTDYPSKRNITGFTALPGGRRLYNGAYQNIDLAGFWWSSTEYSTLNAWCTNIDYASVKFWIYYDDKQYGFSIRCLKD